VYAEARAVVGDEVPEILLSMVREAKDGSVPAAKLCLEVLGVFTDDRGPRVDVSQPLVIIMDGDGKLPPPAPLLPERSFIEEFVEGEFSDGKFEDRFSFDLEEDVNAANHP